MKSTQQRLFTPGSGSTHPALVGRKPQQGVLSRCLADLASGASPPHDVVLTGPRGNGKTVLLNWFGGACERRKPDVVALTPDEVPNRAALAAVLAPRTWASKLLPRKVGVAAGTPGLPAHLGTMNASFWSRLGKGRVGVGLLSEAATREALVGPLAANGVDIDADAVDEMVEDSRRYPYFVQLWGDALWNRHLATGTTRLTNAHVADARPEATAWMTDYYQERYRELEAGGLLPAAEPLATVFRSGADATASDHDIDAALAIIGAEAARLAAREALHRLGYIWCPPGQLPPVAWSAGIPSLMAHVLDRTTIRRCKMGIYQHSGRVRCSRVIVRSN